MEDEAEARPEAVVGSGPDAQGDDTGAVEGDVSAVPLDEKKITEESDVADSCDVAEAAREGDADGGEHGNECSAETGEAGDGETVEHKEAGLREEEVSGEESTVDGADGNAAAASGQASSCEGNAAPEAERPKPVKPRPLSVYSRSARGADPTQVQERLSEQIEQIARCVA